MGLVGEPEPRTSKIGTFLWQSMVYRSKFVCCPKTIFFLPESRFRCRANLVYLLIYGPDACIATTAA